MKYIHVAGTNGKGSTCAYIAAGLRQSGYRTGKFTSPHVVDITERIEIDGAAISPQDLQRLCGAIDCPRETPQFTRLFRAALLYFAEQRADYAVIETGIGGLLDCTNVITPEVSVITRIGFDHTDILGGTLAEIAAHKAGIIKAGVPVVTDPTQPAEAMAVIRETAAAKGSELFVPDYGGGGLPCEVNAEIARTALRVLGVRDCDFSGVSLPARLQTVGTNPTIIVDGSHNIDAVRNAAEFVRRYNKRNVVVFGMLPGKDYAACLEVLAPLAATLITVDDVSDCAEVAQKVEQARQSANPDDLILVCGSMYLAGNALAELRPCTPVGDYVCHRGSLPEPLPESLRKEKKPT